MANSNVYTLEIDLNVLNHLGLNLYSNVPAVLSELIANAWDADAKNVEITISKHSEGKEIVITDDGSGMNINDINGKFLTVGYPRRTESTIDRTPINDRLVMGRKGIGKLSVFSISEHIQVITKTVDDSQVGLELTLEGISEAIDSKNPYHPTPMDVFPNDISIDTSGTVIILKKLKKRIYASLGENLRKRVARRFDVIGNEFQVKIDGDTVEPGFRDYSNLLDYALIYGACEQSGFGCKVDEQSNMVKVANHEYHVTGWIGLIKESGLLQEPGGDNLNKISVLARGKMALEDILQSYREGGLYTKYVIGQIRADFLDETDEEDIATSSRQDFVQNDSRFIAFREFVHKEIKKIGKKREEIKDKEGEAKAREIPAINDWYEDLAGDTRKAAKKLLGRINQIVTDDAHQKTLYKHGILAFEHLYHKEKLSQLELLDINNLEVAVKLFSDLDDIEASWYYQITEGRLEVIKKLSDHITTDALEKVIQKHIYTHLWLLDPSWDRATELPVMEKSVRATFQKVSEQEPPDVKKGRLDIKYKKTSGKHIIVELKRDSVRTTEWELGEQVDKYLRALKQELVRANENTAIEAICLLGEMPIGWDDPEERQRGENTLAAKNIRVVTYQQLIKDAQTSYKSYLDKSKDKGRIRKLLDEIDQS